MFRLRNVALGLALAASVATAGYLRAQPQDSAEQPADVTVPVEKQATLTPQQMGEQADGLIAKMQESLRRGVELQKVARQQKDVIKLNCVNDKLLQIKQLLNIAESARTNLVEAIAQQDEADRYHHFGQITIASEKVQTLSDEAEACVGEEIVFLGPTEVTVDEPDIPDDPTGDDPFDGWEIEPPSYASPFL